MRPTAGKAALRPAQKRSRSSSLRLTRARVAAPLAAAIACDLLDQVVDLGRRAVELDDQQRLDVERVAGVHEVLGGVDRRAGPSSPARPG